MSRLQLTNASIDDFTFQKNVRTDVRIRLEATVKFAVRYNAAQNEYAGDALITVQDAGHEGLFRLKFHHIGVFSCAELRGENLSEAEQRALHREAAEVMQPLWNQTVAVFAALVGIPPIHLPPYRVDDERIHTDLDRRTEKI